MRAPLHRIARANSRSVHAICTAALLFCVFGLCAHSAAQTITIRMINAKSGKPINGRFVHAEFQGASGNAVITIDKQQNIFLQDKPVNIHDLPSALGPTTKNTKRVVYVRADKEVPFGAFASVMDAVKQAGITNISIVTQPIEK